MEQGQQDRAREMYEDSIREKTSLLELQPWDHSLRNSLAKSLHNLAGIHLESDRIDEAQQILDQALSHEHQVLEVNPGHTGNSRDLVNTCEALSWTLLPQGGFARVVELAGEMQRAEPTRPGTIFRAAVLVARARTSIEDAELLEARRQELQAEYAELAMDWLRLAVRHGYKDGSALEGNRHLAPLRPRADFQELLESLGG